MLITGLQSLKFYIINVRSSFYVPFEEQYKMTKYDEILNHNSGEGRGPTDFNILI